MANFIKSGKVKDVYEVSEKELEFQFSDRISVFDKIIPSAIPYKGEVLARTSAYWFDVMKKVGIPTHFIKLTAPNKMLVRRVQVIPDYSKLNNNTRNYLVPLEVIVRYYVYGSLWDRVKQGSVKPEQLGFPRGHEIKQAEQIPEPFVEVTTKLEEYDRNLTKDEALKISGLTDEEYNDMREMCLKADEQINSAVGKRGLIHVDGKKEFAFDENRELMIVDTFGTADEDRFWDANEYNNGKYVERSKEFIRQYYRNSGYHKSLMDARGAGLSEPAIPALPAEMVDQASKIYIKLFEDMTGQKFR